MKTTADGRVHRPWPVLLTVLILALATALPAHATRTAAAEIAFARANNVFLLNNTTGKIATVTTRGTGLQGIYYPWYQWSPDGKYLLLVRATFSTRTLTTGRDLLLLQADGTLLRTLATGLPLGDFNPSWALDGDRIVYVSAQTSSGASFRHTVTTVDTSGKRAGGWTYSSIEGCGGGTPSPAEQLLDAEVGFGDIQPAIQWSITRHLAVYSASCSGRLNVTDTATGTTRPLGPTSGQTVWNEPALSAQGRLAVVVTDPSGTRSIALTTPVPGAATTGVAPGEHPVWSPDGTTLYFVQRAQTRPLTFVDPLGNRYTTPIYQTTIIRAGADGSQVTRLLSRDAFGFGYPSISSDGRTLVFSSVDNMTALAQHLSAGGGYTRAVLQQYGPRVRIVRYTVGGQAVTLALNAGRPVIQP